MTSGWRYRTAGIGGTILLTALAVWASYLPPVQSLLALVPVVGGLPMESPGIQELFFEVATTAIVVLLAMGPLYRPRSRRILDTWMLGLQRVGIAVLALSAVGYFDYSYRLPRSTLITAGGLLGVLLPLFFVRIRNRPSDAGRTIVVGDSPDRIAAVLDDINEDIAGYVAPNVETVGTDPQLTGQQISVADGGSAVEPADVPRLGGLLDLEEVFVEEEIAAAVLAFDRPDRGAFFGVLTLCHDHGVTAKVHRDHAEAVLIREMSGGDLVEIDLSPWDIQDRVLKRLFDAVFAATALVLTLPLIGCIAAAIKLDDGGPVFYSHQRTTTFGETFTVTKFRTMVPDAESDTGATISAEDAGGVDPRVTRIGRLLRPTHLDEIPQLWAVLRGEMSVVGPRPERPELDADIRSEYRAWQNRWFVKPGLTGLAQVRGVTGHEPRTKLQYDIEYINRQSLSFDAKIVVRQLYQVWTDALAVIGPARDNG